MEPSPLHKRSGLWSDPIRVIAVREQSGKSASQSGGNKHSVKDTPNWVKLAVCPRESGSHPRDFPKGHCRERIVESADPRPVDITRSLIP
jgi:hypothetical protein